MSGDRPTVDGPGRTAVHPERIAARPTSLRSALRQDPRHASELVLLYALPQLGPSVGLWYQRIRDGNGQQRADRLRSRVVRRSTGVAGRLGALTGTSMYLCMPPAMTLIYCQQIRMILQLAALAGLDPTSPDRAAEILVIQNRYPDTGSAAAALASAGLPRARGDREPRRLRDAIRQIPAMLGLRLAQVRGAGFFDVTLRVLETASWFVPFIGVPVWAVSTRRATRQLAGRARLYYQGDGPIPVRRDPIETWRMASRVNRAMLYVAVLALGVGLGVAVLELPTPFSTAHWYYIAVAEALVASTFGRVLWITRVPGPSGAAVEAVRAT